ncbi:MAG: ISAs1 family transposase [Treponema sp.]|nr:ISAs1 family transposase [Treponema sp.]
MELTEEDIAWMKECLSGIKDERRQSGHFPHKLIDVLVIGLTTIIAGWDEFTVMEDFGTAKESFFRTFLELPHGIPDEKTFARVFSWIEPGSLLSSLQTWLMGVNKAGGRTITIDGKTIRGSACQGRNGVHIVSVWISAQNMVLG